MTLADMMPVYLTWSLILLGIWGLVYRFHRAGRRKMWRMSWLTAPLGLTEPLFVPEYWSPPTLFDAAARFGFDLESLIFAFAIGGLASAVHDPLSRPRQGAATVTTRPAAHRYHFAALATPFVAFPVLHGITGLNPIYDAAIALFLGGVATAWCRPDLLSQLLGGSLVLTALYFAYFFSLAQVHPGYVAAVWNPEGVTGWLVLGVPFEELLFAATLGLLWSGLYEHMTWSTPGAPT